MVRLSIMVSPEATSHESMDGGRVFLFPFLFCSEGLWRWNSTMLGKGKHLEELAIKGNEIFFDECVSGQDIFIH